MTPLFAILAGLTVGSAIAAMTLRNLVHCALSLALSFAGLAAIYLHLNAQFVGFVQILVYIGAVAILIVFAILLTRSSDNDDQPVFSKGWLAGTAVSAGVFAVLAACVMRSHRLTFETPAASEATVREIGTSLMSEYVLPLQVIGLLLTAALIGAVIIAMKEKGQNAP